MSPSEERNALFARASADMTEEQAWEEAEERERLEAVTLARRNVQEREYMEARKKALSNARREEDGRRSGRAPAAEAAQSTSIYADDDAWDGGEVEEEKPPSGRRKAAAQGFRRQSTAHRLRPEEVQSLDAAREKRAAEVRQTSLDEISCRWWGFGCWV